MKTFWGWRDQQLPDGTVILNSPSGKTYVTTPGSALLFPSLCLPTGDVQAPEGDPPTDHCNDRTAMMPDVAALVDRTAPAASPPNADKTTLAARPAAASR